MAREAKKHNDGAAQPPQKSLEELVLDQTQGKYALVSLASVWALELRRRDLTRQITQADLLDMALMDLLSGVVTPEVVLAAHAEAVKAALAAADGKERK